MIELWIYFEPLKTPLYCCISHILSAVFVSKDKEYFWQPQSQILAIFGPFGPFLGAPWPKLGSPPNSQLVWKSQHICPVPRSNFVPRRSNRFGPPEPSKSDFGRFWAIWTLFWSILGPGGPKSGPRSGHSLERGLGYPDRWEISVCSHQTLKKFRTPPLSP